MIMLKIFILSWWISKFEPIQWGLDSLPDNVIKYFLILMSTCLKCSSFWVGLIMTGNIFIACFAAFLGMIYTKTIGNWENTIKINK